MFPSLLYLYSTTIIQVCQDKSTRNLILISRIVYKF
nr:MAG TPA: Defensin-like peptide family [Bacteriophage sp.]